MRTCRLVIGLGFGLFLAGTANPPGLFASDPTPDARIFVGKDLFVREWVVDDPRARGGDGLGPVYNASSCVACHFLGGTGGAGPNDRNAQIAVATVRLNKDEDAEKIPRDELIKAHPGFRNASGVVLHAKGVGSTYEDWRSGLIRKSFGRFTIGVTSRNTPALFGVGKIDAIPEAEILAMVSKSHPEAPEVSGHASRLADGKIGRFGWKGQVASLDDFVRTACAVELGLEVSGHPQSPSPDNFAAKAPGLDLSDGECSSMVAYIASLPEPGVRPPFDREQLLAQEAGKQHFASVGCAACHSPSVGDVHDLYSDLLLHDMGPSLVDSGVYYGSPVPSPEDLVKKPGGVRSDIATAREWKTPPLWGLRDSGPYLHDGRAASLYDAIIAHGGEAQGTVDRYKTLNPIARRQIHDFLGSLSAPKPEKPTKTAIAKAKRANSPR